MSRDSERISNLGMRGPCKMNTVVLQHNSEARLKLSLAVAGTDKAPKQALRHCSENGRPCRGSLLMKYSQAKGATDSATARPA